MHGHHGRCREMHGLLSDEREIHHLRMRCHGMGHGHDPSMCGRHFFSDEEKSEMLQKYKEWLDKEAKGVQEMLDKMKE